MHNLSNKSFPYSNFVGGWPIKLEEFRTKFVLIHYYYYY